MPDEAATRKDVAEMSDKEMVDQLAVFFDEDQPLPEEQAQDQPAEEVEATADEEVGDVDISEETEADEDTEVEAEEGAEASDDDKWMPNSLEELAEALEAQPDQVLETLKVKIKADGKESDATLKDVIASYQLRKTLDQRLEAFANERKGFEAQAQAQLEKLNADVQAAEATISGLESMLFQDYQSVNWDELKSEDPTEYMLKQQEMRDRYSALQEAKNQWQKRREEDVKKQQEEFGKQYEQIVHQQLQMAQERIPEWRDESKLKSDIQGIQGYLKNLGATDQELSTMIDHRLYVLAHKAMKYDEMQHVADPKKKQMKAKPKFAKPGARKDPAQVSQKRKQEAFERAKKLQTDDAWAEALLAKLS